MTVMYKYIIFKGSAATVYPKYVCTSDKPSFPTMNILDNLKLISFINRGYQTL